jgi:hypothetical protein
MPEMIGVAFPLDIRDRRKLLEAFPTKTIPPVKPGSSMRRCARCNIPVHVGPRLTATRLKVVCALCAHHLGMDLRAIWPSPTQ